MKSYSLKRSLVILATVTALSSIVTGFSHAVRPREITVEVDAQSITAQTTASTVGDALGELEIVLPEGSTVNLDAAAPITDALHISIVTNKTITINDGGVASTVDTATVQSVGEFLNAQNIVLNPQDTVSEPLDASIANGMVLTIDRYTTKLDYATEEIPFEEVKKDSEDHTIGETVVEQEGQLGVRTRTYEVLFKNGERQSHSLIKEDVTQEPINQVVLVGTKEPEIQGTFDYEGTTPSSLSGTTITMEATAYDPSVGDTTASGLPAAVGRVAVDPTVIPLGTQLYIEGYGYAVAADTGGAIKGYKIDLFFNTYEETVVFGRRNIQVTILD